MPAGVADGRERGLAGWVSADVVPAGAADGRKRGLAGWVSADVMLAGLPTGGNAVCVMGFRRCDAGRGCRRAETRFV